MSASRWMDKEGVVEYRQWNAVAVIQLLRCLQLFVTPWTAACQASLSFTTSQSLFKLMFIESVMISDHLHPLSSPSSPALNLSQHQGLLQWIGSSHHLAKAWELQQQSIQEYSGLISYRNDWFESLPSKGLSRDFSSISVQKHQFFGTLPSLLSSSLTWLLERP